MYPIARVMQDSPSLGNTITVEVLRVHAVEDIIRDGHDDGIDLQPVIQSFILVLVELADFLVLELLDILGGHAVFFQAAPLDILGELLLQLAVIVVGQGDASDIPKAIALPTGGDGVFEVVGLELGVAVGFTALEAIRALASHGDVVWSQSLARMLAARVLRVCRCTDSKDCEQKSWSRSSNGSLQFLQSS